MTVSESAVAKTSHQKGFLFGSTLQSLLLPLFVVH
jgi:hypothetical protein